MDTSTQDLARIALVGTGATLVMDVWAAFLKRAGVPGLNMAYVGRWAGHLVRGRWKHDGIAKAEPVPNEALLGWFIHYAIGIAFAALLAAIAGTAWMRSPSLLPALALGMATVIAPLFVMQPSMGAGIASSRTAAPLKNCLRSFANHTVFGVGLYGAAVVIQSIQP